MKKLFNNPFVMIAVCIIYVFSMAFLTDDMPKEEWYSTPVLFFLFLIAGALFLKTVWLLLTWIGDHE